MIFLLDTKACIRYLRDPNSRVRQEQSSRPPSAIRLSSIVMSELYRGALRSKNPPAERAKVDAFAAAGFARGLPLLRGRNSGQEGIEAGRG